MWRACSPLALADDTEPEPDVALVPLGTYEHEHPTGALLVVEVSDSTLRRDRAKASIYASASVPEYRIVDLTARALEVHRAPRGDRTTDVTTLSEGDSVTATSVDGVAFDVAAILPST